MNNLEQSVLTKFKETITRYRMLKKGDCVLIGCSGGPDSVCLTHLFWRIKKEYGLRLKIIHFQHGLRGKNSLQDEEFVRRWVKELGEQLVVKKIDVYGYARKNKMGIEQAARELRYQWMETYARRFGFQRVSLGHNLGDQAETVMGNLIRGTGTLGLAGIPPIRKLGNSDVELIRPLLYLRRKEIERYLKISQLSFRFDETNRHTVFRRNRIRRELLPLLAEYNPRIRESLSHLAGILYEENLYWDKRIAALYPKIAARYKNQTAIDLSKLLRYNSFLQTKLLQRFLPGETGFTHWQAVQRLIARREGSGEVALPGKRLRKEYRFLFFAPDNLRKKIASKAVFPVKIPGTIRCSEPGIVLKSRIFRRSKKFRYQRDKNQAYFDWAKLARKKIYLRFRRKGDWFYPFGMKGRKKLKDFFIDLKLPREQRNKIPILATAGDILWVAGYRSSEKFKVTAETKQILEMVVKYKKD
ncbi:MAG: tRNA lysidine(34) synthetase TilS [Elusimicrobiota bacterium]